MKNHLNNKPVMMLTVGELMEVLSQAFASQSDVSMANSEEKGKKFVYGVAGLAKLLGCSVSTAQRRISSGKLDKCIIRSGRLIIIDKEAALQMLKGGWV